VAVKDYAYNETRYRMLVQSDENRAEMLMTEAGEFAKRKWELYKQMAAMAYTKPGDEAEAE
jgi:pyruvate-ferredoxin/flavodoxin oxidoreductase